MLANLVSLQRIGTSPNSPRQRVIQSVPLGHSPNHIPPARSARQRQRLGPCPLWKDRTPVASAATDGNAGTAHAMTAAEWQIASVAAASLGVAITLWLGIGCKDMVAVVRVPARRCGTDEGGHATS